MNIGDAIGSSVSGGIILALSGMLAQDAGLSLDAQKRFHTPDSVYVHGALNYFGGGTQDILKLSSQTAGDGAVILASDSTLSDYRPFEIRGKTVTLKYRIPDPKGQLGYSNMSLPGLELNDDGDVDVFNSLKPKKALDFSGNLSFIKVNATHGLRINNSDDSANLVIVEDDGRVRILGLQGNHMRAVYVDSYGYLVVP